MRLTSLLGTAVLLGASFVAAEEAATAPSDVIDVTADTFDSLVVNEAGPILVEFFAPWCGHCKQLAPEYEKAATALKDKNLKLAKVDCVDHADLCTGQGVSGYPTLKVFRNGQASDYGGPRKADGIITYMIKQALPAVSEIKAADLADFQTADKVVVVAFVPSTTTAPASVFSAVADKHRDDYLFGITADEEAAKAAGVTPPAIVLYKKFDDGRADFPVKGIKDTSVEVLEKWLGEEALPLMDEITGDNYPTYAGAGVPIAWLFRDPATEDAILEAIKPVAKKHKGKLNFVWIDASKYGDHAKTLNVKGDTWPAFVIQNVDEELKFPLEGTPSFATVDDFAAKYVAGKLEPSLKSEPVPESNDGPVKVVVGTQYEAIVGDESKDLLIEFYAPWCGHCKRLAPTWDELGEHYSAVKDKLTIAKMDATENDFPPHTPFKIQGFPTIKFRPAGSKEFVDYSGDRSLESFMEFVSANAKNNVAVPEKAKKEPEATSSQVSPTESADAHDHDEL